VEGLTMHESIRKRINDYLEDKPPVFQ